MTVTLYWPSEEGQFEKIVATGLVPAKLKLIAGVKGTTLVVNERGPQS